MKEYTITPINTGMVNSNRDRFKFCVNVKN